MPWTGLPALYGVEALLASIQPMSGLRKVPPERLARSCGMTSVGESAIAQLQIEPLQENCRTANPPGATLIENVPTTPFAPCHATAPLRLCVPVSSQPGDSRLCSP